MNVFSWFRGSKSHPPAQVAERRLPRKEIIRRARVNADELRNELREVNEAFDRGDVDLSDIR